MRRGARWLPLVGLWLAACAAEQTVAQRDRPDSHHNLGLAHLAGGDAKKAIAELTQAVRGDPSDPTIHNAIGLAYLMDRRIDLAIASFRKAIELDPTFSDAYNNLGSAYVQRLDYDRATDAFKQALANPAYLTPQRAHLNLGNVYAAQGRLTDAIEEFKRALDISPDFAEAHNRLGYVYLVQRKPQQAIAELTLALRHAPDLATAHQNLGFAFLVAGDKDRARQAFQRVVELSPTGELAAEAMRQLKRIDQ